MTGREATREDIARRMGGFWNEDDVDAFFEVADPDFELVSAVISEVEGEGSFRGREGLLRYREAIDALFEQFYLEFTEFQHAGDRLLVVGEIRSRSRAGAPLDQATYHVIEFRGDVPVRDRIYMDRDEAQRALEIR